jgi:RNase P/RNase MRP subunit POP5
VWWERSLRSCLDRAGLGIGFRLLRSDGRRALVEVDHRAAVEVRAAWTTAWSTPESTVELATRRTWGTVRGGKAWLRGDRRDGERGTAQLGTNENVATSTEK